VKVTPCFSRAKGKGDRKTLLPKGDALLFWYRVLEEEWKAIGNPTERIMERVQPHTYSARLGAISRVGMELQVLASTFPLLRFSSRCDCTDSCEWIIQGKARLRSSRRQRKHGPGRIMIIRGSKTASCARPEGPLLGEQILRT